MSSGHYDRAKISIYTKLAACNSLVRYVGRFSTWIWKRVIETIIIVSRERSDTQNALLSESQRDWAIPCVAFICSAQLTNTQLCVTERAIAAQSKRQALGLHLPYFLSI